MLEAQRGFTLYRAAVARDPTTIFLVDDDPDMRQLLSLKLREDGYRVLEFHDGREVLDHIATRLQHGRFNHPGIVVSDIRMEGFSGLDLLAGIHQAKWRVPVILMSAFDDQSDRDAARALGAAAVFHKPFDIDDLRTAILAYRRWD